MKHFPLVMILLGATSAKRHDLRPHRWIVSEDGGSLESRPGIVLHCIPRHEAEHTILKIPLDGVGYRDVNCHRWNHELHTAILDDDLEKVKQVLQDGKAGLEDLIPPDSQTYPPIVSASLWNRPKIVQYLLEAGADPYAPSKDLNNTQFTAADVAGSHGFPDIMRVLLAQSEFDPLRTVASDGMTAIHRACFGGLPEHTELVRVMLDAGVNPNAQTRRGSTPLMIAEMYKRHETVELLQTHIRSVNDAAIDRVVQREWDRHSGRAGKQPSLAFAERIMQGMYDKAASERNKNMMRQLHSQLEHRGFTVPSSSSGEL